MNSNYISLSELLEALEAVANNYGAQGTTHGELIANAFRNLINELAP